MTITIARLIKQHRQKSEPITARKVTKESVRSSPDNKFNNEPIAESADVIK